jgi:subtilisin family serine protease
MKTRQPCSGWGPAALLTVAVLAACTDTHPLSPTRSQPVAPSYSTQAALQGDGPRHVLLMRGQGIPGDLRAAVEARGGAVQWSDPEIGVVTTSGLTDAAAAELAARPDVDGINRDLEVRWLPPGDGVMSAAIEAPSAEAGQSGASFFTFFQWNMRQIRADAAWLVTDQGEGALVCILDTGIDPEHLDLAGKVDLAKSTSFVPTEPFLDDRNTHGTFVAALVASNGIGIASVAPAARLCAVKVLDETGTGPFAGVIAGIIHAARVGADVINVSLGAYISMKEPGARGLVRALQRAVDFATRKGALVVAAAGNDGINLDRDPRDFIHVPSQLEDVLSVGATAPFNQADFDALASYTNFGRTGVDVMAPGGDMLTGGQLRDLVLSACSHFQTQLQFRCSTTSYVLGAGTSFAAPHVSGAAAVVEFERRGDQRGKRLGECVTRGADDLGRRGPDLRYGKGRVNVLRAATCRGHRHGVDD